jgi:hypothetical protein
VEEMSLTRDDMLIECVRAQTAEVLSLRAGSPWQGEVVEDKDTLDAVHNMKEADNGKLDDDNFNGSD